MSHELKKAAFASLRLLLRPVVRLMLRCGVTWKELAELCKLVYVEVAAEDFGSRGRPANASRIAILTGLSRRDVKRAKDTLASPDAEEAEAVERVDHASRVLSGWFQDPEFCDPKGKPRALAREGKGSFALLLKEYAPGIPPTAMLKELKRVGAVRLTPQGKVRAVARYFMPMSLDPDAIVRFGGVVRDLAAAVAHNQLRGGREPARFEGRATNLRVRRESRRAFTEYLEKRGMAFLEDADMWLTNHRSSSDSLSRP
jgi:hypothetical protein